jgi:hypothetical protein
MVDFKGFLSLTFLSRQRRVLLQRTQAKLVRPMQLLSGTRAAGNRLSPRFGMEVGVLTEK